MKFNVLLDTPPDEFGGVKVKTDFKNVLKVFRLVELKDIDEEEKALVLIETLLESIPKYDQDKLWDFVEWFLMCGDDKTAKGGQRVFDWEIDSARVYGAFMQAYQIDLTNIRMHWWKFKALFDALPAGSKLMEVMEIRGKKASAKDAPEYRIQLAKLKAAYSIQKGETDIYNMI